LITASKALGSAAVAAPCAHGVVLLPELLAGQVTKEQIILPLTLAYVFSEHLDFRLPLAPAAMPAVEKAFDEILRSMPLASKGVLYVRTSTAEMQVVSELVRSSDLIIRSDRQFNVEVPANTSEVVVLSAAAAAGNSEMQGPRLVTRNIERLRHPELRKKIADCIALFDLQSEGHITHGDFSISW
jgi:hypothetical protein